jgi:hypothetical protein
MKYCIHDLPTTRANKPYLVANGSAVSQPTLLLLRPETAAHGRSCRRVQLDLECGQPSGLVFGFTCLPCKFNQIVIQLIANGLGSNFKLKQKFCCTIRWFVPTLQHPQVTFSRGLGELVNLWHLKGQISLFFEIDLRSQSSRGHCTCLHQPYLLVNCPADMLLNS